MNRNDWTMLALIGVSALGSVGLTSVLSLRCVDAKVSESVIMREAPVEIRWQHISADPDESEISRETLVEGLFQQWSEKSDRIIIPHASYGVTLMEARPMEIPFQTNGLRLEAKHRRLLPLRKTSISYDFRFLPTEVPLSKPSG